MISKVLTGFRVDRVAEIIEGARAQGDDPAECLFDYFTSKDASPARSFCAQLVNQYDQRKAAEQRLERFCSNRRTP